MRRCSLWFFDLFVIIAVFAIVTAALSPLFASARTRTALETCLDNNRQLGMAFALYEDDADGALPLWIDTNTPPAPFDASNPNDTTWDVYLIPFVRSRKVFTCPAGWRSRNYLATALDPVRSYAMPQNVSGLRPARMKAPAKTVLLFEKGVALCGQATDSTGEYFDQMSANPAYGGYTAMIHSFPNDPAVWHFFHGGTGFKQGKVFLFADGHAAFFQALVATQSTTNPFGYYFPNSGAGGWPKGPAGLGYCGSADGLHAGAPTTPGANLPDQM